MKHCSAWLLINLLGLTAAGAQVAGQAFECMTEPEMRAELGSAVPGLLEAVNVDRGDFVTKGQLLATFVADAERAAVKVAKARVEADAQIESAEIRISFSDRKRERQVELYEKNYVSEFNLDEAETEKLLAEQALLEANEAKRLAAAELERSQAILDLKSIRAPFDGVVVKRLHNPGERVEEKPILEIVKINPLNVEVLLPVSMLDQIQPGMKGAIATEYSPEANFIGTVTVVDHVVDAASGLFGVRLELPNPDNSIRAGLECSVKFVESANALSQSDL